MQRCFFTHENTAISFFISALSQVKNTIFFCILIMNEVDCWKLHRIHPCSSLIFWQGTPDLIKFINFIYSADPPWAFTVLDTRKTGERPLLHHEELTIWWADSQYALHTAAKRHACGLLDVPSGWTDRRTGQGPGEGVASAASWAVKRQETKGRESAEGSGGPFKSREWGAQGQGNKDTWSERSRECFQGPWRE